MAKKAESKTNSAVNGVPISVAEIISRLSQKRRETIITYQGRDWKIVEASEGDRGWILARATEQKRIQDEAAEKEGVRVPAGSGDAVAQMVRQYDPTAFQIFALIRLTYVEPEGTKAFSLKDYEELIGLPISAFEPLKAEVTNMLNPETDQEEKEKNS